ncbi:hypothetical protein ABEY44_28050 [Priestia megaterium]
MNPDKKLPRLPMPGELFIFSTILRKKDLMLIKTVVTAIIGGIIFSLLTKFFTRRKADNKNTNYVVQGFSFAIIFFIMLLVTKTFT